KDSMLNWMTTLIRLRKECPEIGWGEWQILPVKQDQVLVMLYSQEGSALVIIHNFDDDAHEVSLELKQKNGALLIGMLDLEVVVTAEDELYQVNLEALD